MIPSISREFEGFTTFQIANPGAGNEINFLIPANRRLRIVSIWNDFLTSVVAGNRILTFFRINNAMSSQFSASPVVQTQGLTWRYYWTPGIEPLDFTAVDGRLYPALSDQLILGGGDYLRTTVYNRQAGDTISNIFISAYTSYDLSQ